MQNSDFIKKAKNILKTLGPLFDCYHEATLTGKPKDELFAQLYYLPTNKYMEFVYTPEKAPCKIILSEGQCSYGESVQILFPEDKGLCEVNAQAYIGYKTSKGLIAILSPHSIENPDSILNLLKKSSS